MGKVSRPGRAGRLSAKGKMRTAKTLRDLCGLLRFVEVLHTNGLTTFGSLGGRDR